MGNLSNAKTLIDEKIDELNLELSMRQTSIEVKYKAIREEEAEYMKVVEQVNDLKEAIKLIGGEYSK